MKPKVSPYLYFPGTCEEAVNYYIKVLGAKLEFMVRYGEAGSPLPEEKMKPGAEDRIFHVTLRIGESIIMAGDSDNPLNPDRDGYSLSIDMYDQERAEQYFHVLSQEGEIVIPLASTFWSPMFGAVKDRYGVNWIINVVSAECIKQKN